MAESKVSYTIYYKKGETKNTSEFIITSQNNVIDKFTYPTFTFSNEIDVGIKYIKDAKQNIQKLRKYKKFWTESYVNEIIRKIYDDIYNGIRAMLVYHNDIKDVEYNIDVLYDADNNSLNKYVSTITAKGNIITRYDVEPYEISVFDVKFKLSRLKDVEHKPFEFKDTLTVIRYRDNMTSKILDILLSLDTSVLHYNTTEYAQFNGTLLSYYIAILLEASLHWQQNKLVL